MKFVRKKLIKKFSEQHKILSHYLKLARRDAGMTQREAGAQMGRDQAFITKLESGTKRPLFVEMEQLAITYRKKDLNYFVTIDEVERVNPDLVIPANVLRYSLPRPAEIKSRSQKGAQRAANVAGVKRKPTVIPVPGFDLSKIRKN